MTSGHKKDRSSVSADRPVETNTFAGDWCTAHGSPLGVPTQYTKTQRDWQLLYNAYAHGKSDGRREGIAQGLDIKRSVENMFSGWDGAENARQRSVQRFRTWRNANRGNGGDVA